MTNREAIKIIKIAIAEVEWEYPMECTVVFQKATEALAKSDRCCGNCDWFNGDHEDGMQFCDEREEYVNAKQNDCYRWMAKK